MPYHHLCPLQKYEISTLRKAGFSQSSIAEKLKVNRSTISRELRRNATGKSYNPKHANAYYIQRRQRLPTKIKGELQTQIIDYLNKEYSPEQITGRMKLEGKQTASHETIYQFIFRDKAKGGELYTKLRTERKKRRKRLKRKSMRGQIPDRVSIDQRPSEVAEKQRIGDWEGDTVIGKDHKGALLTLVERKSKFTYIQLLESKEAAPASRAIQQCLSQYPDKVLTLTTDNGKEFSDHKQIANNLNIGFYFAHPYHSWERGLNENTNRLIRQYFPKKSDFTILNHSEIQAVMDKLNNRPRKSLGFFSPAEVFFDNKPIFVALRT